MMFYLFNQYSFNYRISKSTIFIANPRMTDMTHKKQIMKIDNNSEEDIKPDDFIGSNRPTISLRVGDKIGSNGPIDGNRGENKR